MTRGWWWLALLVGCTGRENHPASTTTRPLPSPVEATTPPAATAEPRPTAAPGTFDERLLEIGRTYSTFERASPDLRIAPAPCDTPIVDGPKSPALQRSRSADEHAHGLKLFRLFTPQRDEYRRRVEMPVGAVLVKEGWSSEVVGSLPGVETVLHEGKRYRATAKAALFVMLKYPPETAGTDRGWVYATLSPDGGHVLDAGPLPRCAGCHGTAGPSRVFGLAPGG